MFSIESILAFRQTIGSDSCGNCYHKTYIRLQYKREDIVSNYKNDQVRLGQLKMPENPITWNQRESRIFLMNLNSLEQILQNFLKITWLFWKIKSLILLIPCSSLFGYSFIKNSWISPENSLGIDWWMIIAPHKGNGWSLNYSIEEGIPWTWTEVCLPINSQLITE